jgi:FkbM family methyltransferase
LVSEFISLGGVIDLELLSDIVSGNVKSQNLQDLKALKLLHWKKNGYYVEFGADDGLQNSNTYFLKEKFGYQGILAEPNPERYELLKLNRPKDFLSNALIWCEKNIEFEFTIAGQLSTISKFVDSDVMVNERKSNTEKKVKLITTDLASVLRSANAPKYIDFLSMDTEGSEFEILEKFKFDDYVFKVICIEHNNLEKILKLDNLLISNGYKKDLTFVEGIDSFYIHGE